MIAASDSFATAIREGYTVASKVVLQTAAGEFIAELPMIDGSVSLDGTAATRGALTVNLAASEIDDLVPDIPTDPLAPYGNEAIAYRGVTYPDGTTEYIQLGVFVLDEFSGNDTGDDLDLSVTFLDRSSILIDAVFEEAGVIAEGTNAYQAIIDLVTLVYPDCEFAFSDADTDVTLPALSYEVNDDRWDFCRGCAEAAASTLYFNNLGQLAVAHTPQLISPDLVVAEGEGGVLLGVSKRWGKENAVNRVWVEGTNVAGGDPVVGESRDNSVLSPTYYEGQFGKHTFTYSTEYLPDPSSSLDAQDQVDSVAETILAQKLGTGQEISFQALVDPRLEPFDVVQVTRERLKVDELHIVDSLSIPLTFDGEMTCQTRLSRVA